jgi:hypothetical protein
MARNCEEWAYRVLAFVVELLELLCLGEAFLLADRVGCGVGVLGSALLIVGRHYVWSLLSLFVR